MRKPRLTLALLVRDQEPSIGHAIASASAYVDEVLVRDTGSRDATSEIARSMGATVLRGAWRDDFAAARNLLLDACRTEWVLFLDGDERVESGADELPRLVRHAASESFTVDIESAIGFDRWDRSRAVRLVKNRPRLRFRYRVHERLEGLASPPEPAPVRILHDGFAGPRRLEKAIRNLSLLDLDLAQDAADPYLRWQRGRELEVLGRGDEARRDWDLMAKTMAGIEVHALARLGFGCEAAADWIGAMPAREEASRATPLTARLILAHPDRPLALWLHARALAAAGRKEHSRRAIERLLGAGPWTFAAPGEETLLTQGARELLHDLGVHRLARREPTRRDAPAPEPAELELVGAGK